MKEFDFWLEIQSAFKEANLCWFRHFMDSQVNSGWFTIESLLLCAFKSSWSFRVIWVLASELQVCKSMFLSFLRWLLTCSFQLLSLCFCFNIDVNICFWGSWLTGRPAVMAPCIAMIMMKMMMMMTLKNLRINNQKQGTVIHNLMHTKPPVSHSMNNSNDKLVWICYASLIVSNMTKTTNYLYYIRLDRVSFWNWYTKK